MIERAGKRRKIYVDNPKGKSKPTSIIHVPGNSLDEYKVLGDFFYKYPKIRPIDDRGNDPAKGIFFNRQQENNHIF